MVNYIEFLLYVYRTYTLMVTIYSVFSRICPMANNYRLSLSRAHYLRFPKTSWICYIEFHYIYVYTTIYNIDEIEAKELKKLWMTFRCEFNDYKLHKILM